MWTEEEVKQLTDDEDELTDEQVAVLLLALGVSLSNIEKEIRNFYQLYGKDGVVTFAEAKKWISSKNHTRRITSLQLGINNIFDLTFSEYESLFVKHLKEIIIKEMDFFGCDLNLDDILHTPWGADGLTALQRLDAYKQKWSITLNNDIKISILKQDEVIDILSKVAKRGESMETILRKLWRTESNAISSITREKIYKKKNYINYRFYNADSHACSMCTPLHHKVFPVSEYKVGLTANPLHSNCRCFTYPVE